MKYTLVDPLDAVGVSSVVGQEQVGGFVNAVALDTHHTSEYGPFIYIGGNFMSPVSGGYLDPIFQIAQEQVGVVETCHFMIGQISL